jgi:hypothetical protein
MVSHKLAFNMLLKKHHAIHGYHKQLHTPGLFKHNYCPVWFNLAMDNFGIKDISESNLQHLYDSLHKETHDIFDDRVGNLYCGINLTWHYKCYIDLSMPMNVIKQLTHYAHLAPVKPQHCPFSSNPIIYGEDNQATTPTNTSPLLNNARKKQIQQIVGSFLYYA